MTICDCGSPWMSYALLRGLRFIRASRWNRWSKNLSCNSLLGRADTIKRWSYPISITSRTTSPTNATIWDRPGPLGPKQMKHFISQSSELSKIASTFSTSPLLPFVRYDYVDWSVDWLIDAIFYSLLNVCLLVSTMRGGSGILIYYPRMTVENTWLYFLWSLERSRAQALLSISQDQLYALIWIEMNWLNLIICLFVVIVL